MPFGQKWGEGGGEQKFLPGISSDLTNANRSCNRLAFLQVWYRHQSRYTTKTPNRNLPWGCLGGGLEKGGGGVKGSYRSPSCQGEGTCGLGANR